MSGPAAHAGAVAPVDQAVARQVRQRARHAVPLQIGRRRADQVAVAADALPDQAAVGLLAHPDHHVHALDHRVHHPLGQLQFHAQLRMAQAQARQHGHHVAPRESRQAAHAQLALNALFQRNDLGTGLRHVVQDLHGALVEHFAGLGQRQGAGGAQEQRHLQFGLQRPDLARHGRGHHAAAARHLGEALRARDVDEDRQVFGEFDGFHLCIWRKRLWRVARAFLLALALTIACMAAVWQFAQK